jgi:hypothetical protein
MAEIDTYSRKGFLFTLVFSAALSGATGVVAYVTAPETVTCSRTNGIRIDCSLVRTIGERVPLPPQVIADVAEIRIVQPAPPSVSSGNTRSVQAAPRLRFGAPDGEFFSVQSHGSELDAIRRGVQAMLDDRAAPDVTGVLAGTPRHHTWSSVACAVGLSIVPLWILGYLFPALRPKSRVAG